MRILFCMTNAALFEYRCAPLARMLKEQGHQIKVLTFFGDPPKSSEFYVKQCDWVNFDLTEINDFEPQLIIIWNGRFISMNAITAYLKNYCKVIIMENAWYTPSENSYLAEDLAQVSSIAEVPYTRGVADRPSNKALLERLKALYLYDTKPTTDLPEKYIFIPMQLETDTQIQVTSDKFKTMNSLIGYVRYHYPSTPIVVRNHPVEPNKERPSYVINATAASSSIQLAVGAEMVIGINSTVLVESMLFGVPTRALGHTVAGQTLKMAPIGNYKDMYNYRALVLAMNQWEFKDPPGWVIDKIETLDFTPRVP